MYLTHFSRGACLAGPCFGQVFCERLGKVVHFTRAKLLMPNKNVDFGSWNWSFQPVTASMHKSQPQTSLRCYKKGFMPSKTLPVHTHICAYTKYFIVQDILYYSCLMCHWSASTNTTTYDKSKSLEADFLLISLFLYMNLRKQLKLQHHLH